MPAPLPPPYRLVERVPTPEEHGRLALAAGWQEAFRWEAVPRSLAASLAGAVVEDADGTVVGMGRLVGDGACYCYVQDVVVDPDHRGRGLGRALVDSLTAQARAAAGGDVFVGLFATAGAVPLYRRAGFDEGGMTGLQQVVRDG